PFVPVLFGDTVDVYAVPANGDPELVIAPVRMIAMTWKPDGGDAVPAGPAIMEGDQPPINSPFFRTHNERLYGASYLDGQPVWTPNGPPFTTYASGGVNCGKDARSSTGISTQPYMTLGVGQDVTGLFSYGLEIHAWADGRDLGSYWWDPRLQIRAQ
ncbi:MAG: hypothetical protein R3B70_49315, partial [Polyangiaceae bacterium]